MSNPTLRTFKSHFLVMIKGMAMGTADMIPGVSGGTMAYITGIYERLLAAIAAIDSSWLKSVVCLRWRSAAKAIDWELLVPLLIGLVGAVIFLTKVVSLPHLLKAHPEPVYGLFFGLIAGSIWVLLSDIPRTAWSWQNALWLVAGIVVGALIVSLKPTHTPDDLWFIFTCGVVAISAMLLPGVSGSFILLLLGKYVMILSAIAALHMPILLTFLAGCVVGLMVFSRLIGWLMRRYKQIMTLIICGILIGTLIIIWPFQQREFVTVRGKEKLISSHPIIPEHLVGESLLAVGMMVLGVALVMVLQRMAAK